VSAAGRRARLALTPLLAVYAAFRILHQGHYGWLDSLGCTYASGSAEPS